VNCTGLPRVTDPCERYGPPGALRSRLFVECFVQPRGQRHVPVRYLEARGNNKVLTKFVILDSDHATNRVSRTVFEHWLSPRQTRKC
jgi:hypothetical protein